MQAPSVTLYGSLIPYITNITLRARYYSFYPWLCDQYARVEGRTAVRSWQVFVRRAEALLALASCAVTPNHYCPGVGGVTWASAQVKAALGGGRIDFGSAAEPGMAGEYLKARFGVFGQAYAAVLNAIEVVVPGEAHEIPVPGPTNGRELVRAFETAVGKLGEAFIEVLRRGETDFRELESLGSTFSPDQIEEESAERSLLEQLIFADGNETRVEQKRSLMLLLLLANQLGRVPSVSEVRWSLYSGFDSENKPLRVPNALASTVRKWQAYQANELGHVALEALLKLTILSLPHGPQGRPVTETVAATVNAVVEVLPNQCRSWRQFRESVDLWEDASKSGTEGAEATQCERVFALEPAESAASGLFLLALLDRRWPGAQNAVGEVFGVGSTLNARFGKRTVMGVIDYLRANEDSPMDDVLAGLVKHFIIDRHLKVALQKLRYQENNTFLFELMNGNIVYSADTSPVFTNPRLATSLTFLADVHLVDESGLTRRGVEVFKAA